jgi:cell division protein FtsN
VVGSELSREPAERRVAEFRAQGLRAGVIAEEAAGRTRYRVALGQFESIEQAERFRSDLPAGVPADTWLLRL